jgi:integrase
VDELRLLLDKAPADLVPMFAIGAFAGLRTAELVRLEWSDLNIHRGHINIPAVKSKTARRRLITMEPNLQAWLSPYTSQTGRLWTKHRDNYHFVVTQFWKAAGIAKWAHNALRHGFASYHLARHQDAPRLALDGARRPAHDFQQLSRDRYARRSGAILADPSARSTGREYRVDGAGMVRSKFSLRSLRLKSHFAKMFCK